MNISINVVEGTSVDNLTPQQRGILKNLEANHSKAHVEWDEFRGTARTLHNVDLGPVVGDDATAALDGLMPLFGPPRPAASWLRRRRDRVDGSGARHLEYQQVVEGANGAVDLYRSVLVIHLRPDGQSISSIQSNCFRDVAVAPFGDLDQAELHRRLLMGLEAAENADELRRTHAGEPLFPIVAGPQLVIYPRRGLFRPTYVVHAYALPDDSRWDGTRCAVLGKAFIDGQTLDRFEFMPLSRHARVAGKGSGLSVTPITGRSRRRELNITADTVEGGYYLEDTTLARPILTFSAGNDCERFGTYSVRRDALGDGLLPLSRSDRPRWDRAESGPLATRRARCQRPEVDLHHYLRATFEWYHRLAGRVGWDNDEIPSCAGLPIRGVAHVRNTYGFPRARMESGRRDQKWLLWLEFPDFEGRPFTYAAGSFFLVAHEYHHAVSACAIGSESDPDGFDVAEETVQGAAEEGLADAFGAMVSGDWRPCRDISPTGSILRNLAFPRDTLSYDPANLDHFGDFGSVKDNYARGTILAHAAYLMAVGGVHQRASRSPNHIAVPGLGTESRAGTEFPKAARIWYHTLVYNFSHHGPHVGDDLVDRKLFPDFASGCVNTAAELYGAGSREHRLTARAFYAVGLHAADGGYGPDAGFLPPAIRWPGSLAYVGLAGPRWSSRDLFVHNGNGRQQSPRPSRRGPDGGVEPVENRVYCRVRNFGDAQAHNLDVTFEYAPLSTTEPAWQPVRDAAGRPQRLMIDKLEAGQANFPDETQHAPPVTASVPWCLPPQPAGAPVRHYCLRARLTGDGRPLDEVRSVLAHLPVRRRERQVVTVIAGNPTDEVMRARIEVEQPKGWLADVVGDRNLLLRPGEKRDVRIQIRPRRRECRRWWNPPFDAEVTGRLHGVVRGEFRGVLAETGWTRGRLTGLLSSTMDGPVNVFGRFLGTIDRRTGRIRGKLTGGLDRAGTPPGQRIACRVDARLSRVLDIRVRQMAATTVIGETGWRIEPARWIPSPRRVQSRRVIRDDCQVRPGQPDSYGRNRPPRTKEVS